MQILIEEEKDFWVESDLLVGVAVDIALVVQVFYIYDPLRKTRKQPGSSWS